MDLVRAAWPEKRGLSLVGAASMRHLFQFRSHFQLRTVEHQDRNKIRSRCGVKLAWLDDRVRNGATGEDLLPSSWEDSCMMQHDTCCLAAFFMRIALVIAASCSAAEDILDSHRIRAAAVGLGIRPRRFQKPAPGVDEGQVNGAVDGSPAHSEENPGSGTNYSSTDVRFLQLRHAHGVQGVLQVHQASGI